MSAREALEERIAALDRQIRRIQASIDKLKSRDLPSADLEQSLLLLLETRRAYVARREKMRDDEAAGGSGSSA